jgi:4-aminobutyrate aminotransferase-like enzyme
MDYRQQIEEAKQKLFSLGFTEEKYNELLEVATEELIDKALSELQEKELTELENVEKSIITEPKTLEELNQNIQVVFTSAYGAQSEEMKGKMLLDFLNKVVTQTSNTKDLITRYRAGDPTAITTVESNKNNPEIQELVQYLKESVNTTTE